MRYLLTGITGVLGPHLAKQLINNGHEIKDFWYNKLK
jgi:nucleoside-diphosphate-sugar epimerase